LIRGIARVGGTDFRFRLHRFENGSYQEVDQEAVDPSLPMLFKPMGSPIPDSTYIASDADYVDYLTELMGGFGVPAFLKAYRPARQYLFLGLRMTRDTERMVLADIIYAAAEPAGWALIPEPTDKERRYCASKGIEIIEADIPELLRAVEGAGDHAEDGAGGVGIAAAVDARRSARRLEAVGGEQRLEDGAQGVDDEGAGVLAAAAVEAEGAPRRPGHRRAGAARLGRRRAARPGPCAARTGCRRRRRVVVGDMGLARLASSTCPVGAEGGERDRQAAHAGAVAGVELVLRHRRDCRCAGSGDAAAHRVADVDGLAAHPVAEGLGGGGGATRPLRGCCRPAPGPCRCRR
jgi:hypothetical protein